MFCKNCGAEVADGEQFCRNCGAQVQTPVQQAPAYQQPQQSYQQPQQGMYNQPAPGFNQQPQYDQYGQPYAAPVADGTPGAKAKVTFTEAVKMFFTNYVKFDGRSVLTEYWYVFLFSILVSAVLGVFAGIISLFGADAQSVSTVLSSLWSVATVIPSIAVAVRRMHDTGRSGWCLLISLVPLVGWIIEIVWLCKASDGDNQYGPAPRQ